ncbi:MAG TPA: SLC13 family permease [Phycisphaerae bacterium]|nr:SLC13 family permease [Phycisphaerae bacterium]
MNWQGWFTLALVLVMLLGLARRAHLADIIFLGGLTLLALLGIISPAEALSGFSNPGMLTVAALFVVAAGLRESGALDGLARRILGQPQSERRVLGRLLLPIAAMSAFLNNTTIVAMGMPIVVDWCRKHRQSASRYLMPMSHATVAAGLCTLIGTSTNLVVHGMMVDNPETRHTGMGFFEIGYVGLPVTIVAILYLVFIAPKLLPARQELFEQLGESRREYMIEMLVEPACPFVGQSVQAAGLRQLPGLFLVEIERDAQVLSPVGPDELLEAGDHLVFVGVVGTIVDLQKTKGLVPIEEQGRTSRLDRLDRRLCEAVVSPASPLVGRSIRGANFRTVYDAAVIAVHRSGERLQGKIGNIVLRPGDTLLLQTATGFLRAHRNNPDFYLVSEVDEAVPVRHEKATLALVILGAMVVMMGLPDVLQWTGADPQLAKSLDRSRVFFAFAAAGLMVIARCVAPSTARRNIQWDVLYVIAASFGIARAMENTGAAKFIVDLFHPLITPFGPVAAVVVIYLITNLLTELLTNNAAAALVFPVAIWTAKELQIDPRPLVMTVTIAASAAFATPIGYQTNMMIFGPGGYRFSDFVKVGLPLNVLCFLISVLLIPRIWSL